MPLLSALVLALAHNSSAEWEQATSRSSGKATTDAIGNEIGAWLSALQAGLGAASHTHTLHKQNCTRRRRPWLQSQAFS
jgi:hypothetical protein